MIRSVNISQARNFSLTLRTAKSIDAYYEAYSNARYLTVPRRCLRILQLIKTSCAPRVSPEGGRSPTGKRNGARKVNNLSLRIITTAVTGTAGRDRLHLRRWEVWALSQVKCCTSKSQASRRSRNRLEGRRRLCTVADARVPELDAWIIIRERETGVVSGVPH